MEDEQTPVLNFKPKKKILGINWTKKKIIWTAVILLVVGFIAYRIHNSGNPTANIQTDLAQKQDIKQTVLATGQVVSGTDLDLSFKGSGVVNSVKVAEGDTVKAGAVLAVLDQTDELASLTSAQGTLASAQANYQKVLAGASSQDIDVSQTAVATAQVTLSSAQTSLQNTQSQQNTAVANAYSALLNTTITAVPSSNNIGTAAVTITGTYTGQDQGVYDISFYGTGAGQYFQTAGLETASGLVKSQPVALGSKGLFIQFSGNVYNNDTYTITIPNTSAAAYVANYNAYQTALQTKQTQLSAAQAQVDSAQAALAQAQAALALKQEQARPADVEAAQAQILSAQGQVEAAQGALSNTVITAPADGTITNVNIKTGELAQALQSVITLQDVSNLHVEADVSEANIASLSAGQSVDITFDALGPDRHFTGTVQTINPGATVISGVVDYLVKASIPSIPEVKPGMTANMTILVAQKSGVIAVPSTAIINQNGKTYVRVIDDSKKKTYHEVEVQTGLQADGGLVEVTSGLNQGQEIVTYIKQ